MSQYGVGEVRVLPARGPSGYLQSVPLVVYVLMYDQSLHIGERLRLRHVCTFLVSGRLHFEDSSKPKKFHYIRLHLNPLSFSKNRDIF